MLHPALSLFARRDIAPNRGRLWSDSTAPLEPSDPTTACLKTKQC